MRVAGNQTDDPLPRMRWHLWAGSLAKAERLYRDLQKKRDHEHNARSSKE